jgi:GGDEF domain-containing protein
MRHQFVRETVRMTLCEKVKSIWSDHLTGVQNRKAFDNIFYDVVAIVDMDSFKWINDTFGHQTGNQMLQLLARKLKLEFGEDDVFRIGGDEFAVVGSSIGEIANKLDQLRRRDFDCFSFGVWNTMTYADQIMLKDDKARRMRSGQRVERGATPLWRLSVKRWVGVK